MDTKINSQYRVGTFSAIFTTIGYGVMRYFEGGAYNAWENHGLLSFYMCLGAALIIFLIQVFLRNSTLTPFCIATTLSVLFAVGAYITTEWSYYYLVLLGLIGLVCLYGRTRAVIFYIVVSFVQNIIVYTLFMNNSPDGFATHMLMGFFMYLFGTSYIVAQFYLANKKDGAAQGALQAFSSLLANTPNLMVIVDGKRRVRYISAPLAEFSGIDEKIAIGRPLVDLFTEENIKLMFADILDAENFYSATREIDMNNEPHYFKIMADKLSDKDDGMFIEITDMTEIVLASLEAEKSRGEAEAANKSKSAFLAAMSHEIRTPMNAIIGISEIQLMRGDLSDDMASEFRQIHTSSHGLLGIINDILDLSKIETGKLTINPNDYDTASLINDAIQLNMVRIGSKPIAFSLDLDSSLPARMVGDEMRLKQVLTNILSNAFKYTEEGCVKLSVSHRVTESVIELKFVVSDTGQGMRKEDLGRLFEAYSRFNQSTNRYIEGTGLGLNITHRLVSMMDGRIDVQSEYGKGSVFTVTVLQQPSEDNSVIGTELAERLSSFEYAIDKEIHSLNIRRDYMPYGRVLVVDDVETNLYVARGLLTPYGLTIETALSGFEAIDKISSGNTYDIVFMDHMMPKMDGIETADKLRKSGYNGTIVALTANAIAGNDKMFKESGFEDFISKPIDIRQMNIVLNKYIRDKHTVVNGSQNRVPLDVLPPSVSHAAPTIDKGLLEIFKRDAMKAIEALEQAAKDGDYKLYATTAHAMKSATLNIGRDDVSLIAKSLEAAGNSCDKSYIDDNTAELINALKSIIRDDNTIASGDIAEDTDLLAEKLALISDACEDYDSGLARKALKELSKQPCTPSTSAVLDEISEMVLCSDFDEAADKAAELRMQLLANKI